MARVLLVFEPPDGGVADHVAQLALGLGEHGHSVEVAGPAASTVAGPVRAANLPYHSVALQRGYRRPRRDAAALRQLVGLLRARRYDLVHCHASKAGAIGRIAAAVTRVPAVYTPNCFGWEGDVSPRRRVFAVAVEWVLGRTASALIICVCEAERASARRRRIAPDQRLRRVYNAVAPCGDEPPDPALERLRGDGTLAAVIAVLRPQKRVDLFLQAAPAVLERVPDARLAVIGNGELDGQLRAQARALGLLDNPRFAFLGYAPPSSRYLRALDVFVLPSGWEAMPLGVLEALACGVPQVATDVGGTGEAVDAQTGRLIPPRDPTALTEALVELLADERVRGRMARASQQRFAEHDFSVRRMVRETAAVYAQALAVANG